jgi:hypothetical protein
MTDEGGRERKTVNSVNYLLIIMEEKVRLKGLKAEG